jgi:hypothetical protein
MQSFIKAIMKVFFLFFLLIAVKHSVAQPLPIIPEPVKTELQIGSFNLSSSTVLVITDKAEKASADFFNTYLKQLYGFSLKVTQEVSTHYIRLSTKTLHDNSKELMGDTLAQLLINTSIK